MHITSTNEGSCHASTRLTSIAYCKRNCKRTFFSPSPNRKRDCESKFFSLDPNLDLSCYCHAAPRRLERTPLGATYKCDSLPVTSWRCISAALTCIKMFSRQLVAFPAVLSAVLGSVLASGIQPRDGSTPHFPYDENTTSRCSFWLDNDGSFSCEDTLSLYGISLESFMRWVSDFPAGGECGDEQCPRTLL